MRRTFTDDAFDEWEAYVTAGEPGTSRAARVMFVCVSQRDRTPRAVRHESGDPATAENELMHMDDAGLLELFERSEPIE